VFDAKANFDRRVRNVSSYSFMLGRDNADDMRLVFSPWKSIPI